MLVVSRKTGESLLIGENIYVKIVSVDGERVKVAIDAPKNIRIMRNELVEAMVMNHNAIKSIPQDTISKLKNLLSSKKNME